MKRPNLQPNAKESLAINENCFGAFESSPSFHAFAIVSKSVTAGFPAKSGDGGQVVFSRNKSCGAPQKRLNLSESQPSTSTCACALDWKRGKHSFQTFAFKPSVDLPGLSFTHLKEDVLVQLFFQSSRLSVKISSSSTSMSANETSKPSTKRQRVTSNQRELLWSVWIISFVHVFSIVSESIPAGFPAKSGDGGQVVFSRNKSCGAPQERLGLSESQPSTSTCACALDWKRGKHSFQTFAFKASVDLPGLSFTHLKENVLVQRFFKLPGFQWKFQVQAPQCLQMKRPNLQPNAKESLAINENCFGAFESSPSFMSFPLWVNLSQQAFQQKVEMQARFLFEK